MDDRNDHNDTPLTLSIKNDNQYCAKMLLDAGAKLYRVDKSIEIPFWLQIMSTKRSNALASVWALLKVMRKRFKIEGQHIGNRLPRDLSVLISKYLWSTRFDERWV